MPQPLDGVRVIEVAGFQMVPSAGAILADWGADVIKIEDRERGDPARGLVTGPYFRGHPPTNYALHNLNRGKRSVGLDLSVPEGVATLHTLAASADVFLTSVRPSSRRRRGFDVDDIRAVSPDIVYARGSGFGPRGPLSDKASFDYTAFWARAGVGDAFHHPTLDFPLLPNGGFGDLITGIAIAGGIAAALHQRAATGIAPLVDVSLFAVGAWLMSREIASAAGNDEFVPIPKLRHDESPNPLVNVYRTSDDRYLMIVGIQGDRAWPTFCRAAGHPELVDDPRFATNTVRFDHSAECIALLDEVFSRRTLAEWAERLDETDLAWDVVQTIDEVLADEVGRANGYIGAVADPEGGPSRLVATPVQFDETSRDPRRSPEHAEHTELVLLEAGFTWEQISELRDQGAI